MNWYVEKRPYASASMHMTAWDIARHLYTRKQEGAIVVVSPQPFTLLRVVRKQWLRLIRSVQRERARTLHAGRIRELDAGVKHMQTLTFTSRVTDASRADVLFVKSEELPDLTLQCATAYVIGELDEPTITGLQAIVPPTGLIVAYEEVDLMTE